MALATNRRLEYGRLNTVGIIVFDDEAKEIFEQIKQDECTIFWREF